MKIKFILLLGQLIFKIPLALKFFQFTLHSLAVISGYALIFVRPNVVKDDLRRKIFELLLHLHIFYCNQPEKNDTQTTDSAGSMPTNRIVIVAA